MANLTKARKIVNVLGEGRNRRDRNTGVRCSEPLSKVLLTRCNLLPLGVQS